MAEAEQVGVMDVFWPTRLVAVAGLGGSEEPPPRIEPLPTLTVEKWSDGTARVEALDKRLKPVRRTVAGDVFRKAPFGAAYFLHFGVWPVGARR